MSLPARHTDFALLSHAFLSCLQGNPGEIHQQSDQRWVVRASHFLAGLHHTGLSGRRLTLRARSRIQMRCSRCLW